MSEITVSEIARKLEEHVKWETGYQERFEEKLDLILLQTTKTNGKATDLIEWRKEVVSPLLEDYKDNRSQVKGAGRLWAFVGTGVITTLLLTGTLYLKSLKAEILAEVEKINHK